MLAYWKVTQKAEPSPNDLFPPFCGTIGAYLNVKPNLRRLTSHSNLRLILEIMFLCQTCKAMKPVLKFAFKDEFHTVHHESYKSLMKAAKEGCHICSAVWPTLKFKSDPDTVLAMRPATFCSSADVSGYPLVSISGNHRLVNGNEPEGLEVFQTFPDTSCKCS